MKLDWPGLELMTDVKTTPANEKEEVIVQSTKQNIKNIRNHIR